ncbi:MAG: hypothetical protein ACTHLO_00565 [Pseudolabrys sp.]
MGRVRIGAARAAAGLAAAGAIIALAGCGSTSSVFNGSALDLFSNSPKATQANAAADGAETPTDVECPGVIIRTGAATLTIGSNPKEETPSPLDVRYQGTIVRTARECHVAAGVMNMKVGIEGRVITGPAGGPGAVEVPLRIAVVQDGLNPKTIVSNFGKEAVTLNDQVDRATFTHIDDTISFPLPRPLGLIDSYVVYVGFDPIGARPPEKKKPAVRRAKPAAKPR